MSEVFSAFLGLSLITLIEYIIVINRLDRLEQKIDKLKEVEK